MMSTREKYGSNNATISVTKEIYRASVITVKCGDECDSAERKKNLNRYQRYRYSAYKMAFMEIQKTRVVLSVVDIPHSSEMKNDRMGKCSL